LKNIWNAFLLLHGDKNLKVEYEKDISWHFHHILEILCEKLHWNYDQEVIYWKLIWLSCLKWLSIIITHESYWVFAKQNKKLKSWSKQARTIRARTMRGGWWNGWSCKNVCLANMRHEALSSNPSAAKKKKKEP
jgi:hypothetical protein